MNNVLWQIQTFRTLETERSQLCTQDIGDRPFGSEVFLLASDEQRQDAE